MEFAIETASGNTSKLTILSELFPTRVATTVYDELAFIVTLNSIDDLQMLYRVFGKRMIIDFDSTIRAFPEVLIYDDWIE